MAQPVTNEDLMRYLDGELSPPDRARVDAAVATSTEISRELELFRSVKEDVQSLQFAPAAMRASTWDQVNRRLARPVGWVFLLVGIMVWAAFGVYQYTVAPVDLWQKLATGGIVIGILILLSSVIWERMREWETDPYRHIER